MNQLKKAYSDEEDPYDAINFIDVICNPDVEREKLQYPADISPLKRRIQDFQVTSLPYIETPFKNMQGAFFYNTAVNNLANSGKSLALRKTSYCKD